MLVLAVHELGIVCQPLISVVVVVVRRVLLPSFGVGINAVCFPDFDWHGRGCCG